MKKLKEMIKQIYLKSKVKRLCYLSARLGYKYGSDWIINEIPEAAYLIHDYVKKHPGSQKEMFEEYFKDPDYIFEKAEQKYKQAKMLEKHGFESDEINILR